MEALERILIRLPNWLGDALMARPALHAVRAAYPDARITAAGPGPLLELLRPEGLWQGEEAVRPAVPGLAGRLRAARLDAALVLPPSFSSAWLAFSAGARRRVGFAREGRSPLLTSAPRRPARGDLHLSREYLTLARELGALETPGTRLPPLPLAPDAVAEARALIEPGGPGRAGFAILAPGAVFGPAKRWGATRFAALGRRFAVRGLEVLVCGAEAESDVCAQVAAAVGPAARSLAGRTRLPVQAALCAGAVVVVSNDSGLAHLAAATGAATVAIFGSTSSAWTAPLGLRVRVVQRAPVCSPCFRRTCRIGYACLEAVAVEAVARAADEVAA
jgi:heptosyltransferase-2